ncbi:hypothetical protein ACJRO7_004032 [Eucalyptus globulus]|uniref:Uncharacterized protein n=1 Tax=Eucalyptus globulus TaxID=34317 RepID=A0ABD3IW68_EUCGL
MTTAADLVQAPPRKEELVDADSAQVPNNYDDGDDDALSLCNLSLHCDAADLPFADHVPPTSSCSSSSSSSDHDDFFEFSLNGGSGSSSDLCSDDRSIVFCGKFIPRRGSPPHPPPPPPTAPEKKRSSLQTGGGSPKSTSRRTRSPTVRRRKCRWYLMAFGLARFPTEMALGEMRTRQSRNVEKRKSCNGGSEIVRNGDCGDETKGRGLFGLLKALGSGRRRRADALVKASLGCVPRVSGFGQD